MQLESINNNNNHKNTNFKQLYVSNEALKLLKTSREELNKIPILKKYSKDFDLFIRSEELDITKTKKNIINSQVNLITTWMALFSAMFLPLDNIKNFIAAGFMAIGSYITLRNTNSTAGKYCTISAVKYKPEIQPENFGNRTNSNLGIALAERNFLESTPFNFPLKKVGSFFNISELTCKDGCDGIDKQMHNYKLVTDKTPLMEDYKKHFDGNHFNILDYIKTLPNDISPYKIYDLLNDITRDKELAPKFVKEILTMPKNKKADLKNKLSHKLENLYTKWLGDEAIGYRKAYNDYYHNEIYSKCTNLLDLVKISPNLAPWTLRHKAIELNVEPTLGNVPEDFGDINSYRKLINKLRILKESSEQKNTIKINNKNYKVESNTQGFSAKIVYKITAEDSNKKYFVKFVPYNIKDTKQDKNKKFRENYELRADCPYLNALVDFYLKENNCKNAANILFYDSISQSTIYEETEGQTSPPICAKSNNKDYESLRNLNEIIDIKRLGIQLNDIHDGNFILDKNGNYILVDSGHATFHDDFKPLVMGKQITLSNLCGKE